MVPLLILCAVVLVVVAAQLSVALALLTGMLALVVVPGLVLHRREVAAGMTIGPDAEHPMHGLRRLVKHLGLDVTGIVIGVAIISIAAVVVRVLS